MIKKLVPISFLTVGALFLILTYAFLNGSTCQYSINLHVPDDERDVFMTCYRGKVVALQTKQDQQGNFLSKWKVEARQLRIGEQTVYFVYSRTKLIDDNQEDSNDHFNQISSGYRFLFYRLIRQGNDIYIFQSFPRFYIHKGQIEGKLDIWE
ncbi:hypothetical protein [Vibrio sp. RE88]|uniref:hypothetical protein n=1 Tax=Vibrio sp. RE88 TaxID=2607610 RepID=UPI001493625E|nr:hypothetical protein [Vibrio sp. RE88]NOH63362.1 hypothetical protein [Vibrio sp. RE88]